MQIQDHKLTGIPNLSFVESPNHGGTFAAGRADSIIIHFTAGANAASSVKTLCDPLSANRASAHLVIGRDNSVTQLVPFDKVAWHAGKSSYNGRSGFNQYSIGIEIDNPGELTQVGDRFVSWFGKEYPASQALHLRHRNQNVLKYWHAFTEEQIQLVAEICSLLVRTYSIEMILGHEEISPLRKVDPGPAFPLDRLRDRILNKRSDDGPENLANEGEVTATFLNLRSFAPDGEVINKLPKETTVKVLEEKDGWYHVSTEQKGWVKKEYIKVR